MAEILKLDLKDRKILHELDSNARIPLGVLAKKVKISKQSINYRLRKLEKRRVILRYTTLINIHALGFFSYRLYLRYLKVDEAKEKEIINYFINHKNVIWFASLSGDWDMEVVFLAKNYVEFSNYLKEIKENFGDNFLKYNLSMSPVNYHFLRDYLLNKKRKNFEYFYYGFENKKTSLDKEDLEILSFLSKNSRETSVSMGEKIDKTYHTIQNRIKKLEENKIIQNHRVLIDVSKIGKLYYKILINLGYVSKEKQKEIFQFCGLRNFVVHLIEVLGGWELEVEMEVDNEEQVSHFVRGLRNTFPSQIKDYSILKVLNQHKLDYFPLELS